jgi:hydroxylamine reductase
MPINVSANSMDLSECVAHGVCSISPNEASLQEAMLILLRQTSFYVTKLESFGIKHDDIIVDIIEQVSQIDHIGEYSEQEILSLFSKFYMAYGLLKKTYQDKCAATDTVCEDIVNKLVLTPNSNLNTIKAQGEKSLQKKYKQIRAKQRDFADILLGVMKGVSANVITYKELDRIYKPACNIVLSAFGYLNDVKISNLKMKEELNKLTNMNLELYKLIYNAETELYGQIDRVVVPRSSRPGKAILVSGSSLTDLHAVLEMTKDKGIDVYSNGNLLIANAYPGLREYENFHGHYGEGIDSEIMDLATFPGAILLTKNHSKSVEYLYRGRLFTTDMVAPKGVSKITADDLSLLLESTMKADGFKTGRKKDPTSIGFNYAQLDEKLGQIAKKFEDGTYKKLIFVGFSGDSEKQAQYFEKMFAKLPDDVFVISLSYETDMKNGLTLNIGRSYSLVYSIAKKMFDKIPVAPENISVFLSRCDVRSLSNIISFKNQNFKNIFLSNCSARVINPSTLKAFRKLYGVIETSTPRKDLAKVLSD